MKGISQFKPISSRFSWWQYLFSFVLFSALTVLPVLMFGGGDMDCVHGKIRRLVFLYWAAVALIFCIVPAYQKYQASDPPPRRAAGHTAPRGCRR